MEANAISIDFREEGRVDRERGWKGRWQTKWNCGQDLDDRWNRSFQTSTGSVFAARPLQYCPRERVKCTATTLETGRHWTRFVFLTYLCTLVAGASGREEFFRSFVLKWAQTKANGTQHPKDGKDATGPRPTSYILIYPSQGDNGPASGTMLRLSRRQIVTALAGRGARAAKH